MLAQIFNWFEFVLIAYVITLPTFFSLFNASVNAGLDDNVICLMEMPKLGSCQNHEWY